MIYNLFRMFITCGNGSWVSPKCPSSLGSSFPGALSTENLWRTWERNRNSSDFASASPKQTRGPAENGKYALFLSGIKCPFSSSHLSGQNSSGFSHSLSSWWMAYALTNTWVFFGTLYPDTDVLQVVLCGTSSGRTDARRPISWIVAFM